MTRTEVVGRGGWRSRGGLGGGRRGSRYMFGCGEGVLAWTVFERKFGLEQRGTYS